MSDFDDLRAVASDSKLWRTWVAASTAIATAWSESSAVRFARSIAHPVSDWTPAERVRQGAVTIATAIVTYLAMQQVLPAYAGSGLPAVVFAFFIIAALVVAVLAAPIADAWNVSRLRRWLGREIPRTHPMNARGRTAALATSSPAMTIWRLPIE